jgi:UDP-N-acetylglucosamine--N-acetylmuramyl-(pentapeptide) pyrophosphoryl-undecaprenol N-acetylglucosamine transferase
MTGKPTVFIPSPHVADNHQYKNAMALVAEGAAVCVEEKTLTEGALSAQVKALLADPATRAAMGTRIRERFACPDANDVIHDALMKLI